MQDPNRHSVAPGFCRQPGSIRWKLRTYVNKQPPELVGPVSKKSLGHADYYPRFGFEPASRHGIRSDWEVPANALMILVLDKAAMRGVCGVARYRPEFAEAT